MANGTNVGNAYLQIVPTSHGIQGSISNILNKEAGGAGESAGGLLSGGIKKALLASGIGIALVNTVKGALEEGGKLQQSLGGVEAIFGESADKVKSYASEAWQSVGVSANEYMENVTSFSAALINSMGGDTDRAAEVANTAMKDMGDNANRFGTDMASIQNAYQGFAKQNYTMLDNLKLGYGGTKSEMERLLKDAQEISGVEYDISNLGDVYEAIHVIQGELNVTGTTANEAMVTLTGSMAAMKAAWKDVLGNMGIGESITQPLANLGQAASAFIFNNLIPMIINAVTSLPGAIVSIVFNGLTMLVTNIPTVLSQLVSGLKSIPGSIGDAVKQAWPQLKQAFSDIFSKAINWAKNMDWKGLGKSIIEKIKSIWKSLETVLPNKLKAIGKSAMEFFQNIDWLGLGKKVISFIGSGISLLLTHIPGLLKSIGTTAINWLAGIDWIGLGKNIITFIGNGIAFLVTSIPTALKNIGTTAINWVKGVDWLGLGKTIINKIVEGIKNLITAIPTALKNIGSDAVEKVKNIDWGGLGKAMINGIKDGVLGIGSKLKDAVTGVAKDSKKGAEDVNFTSIGKSWMQGIIDGVKKKAASVKTNTVDVGSQAYRGLAVATLVASPSKLFAELSGWWMAGLVKGIEGGEADVVNAMTSVTDDLMPDSIASTALNGATASLTAAMESGTQAPIIVVNLDANIDGEPLKSKIAEYTINRISANERNLIAAYGG